MPVKHVPCMVPNMCKSRPKKKERKKEGKKERRRIVISNVPTMVAIAIAIIKVIMARGYRSKKPTNI